MASSSSWSCTSDRLCLMGIGILFDWHMDSALAIVGCCPGRSRCLPDPGDTFLKCWFSCGCCRSCVKGRIMLSNRVKFIVRSSFNNVEWVADELMSLNVGLTDGWLLFCGQNCVRDHQFQPSQVERRKEAVPSIINQRPRCEWCLWNQWLELLLYYLLKETLIVLNVCCAVCTVFCCWKVIMSKRSPFIKGWRKKCKQTRMKFLNHIWRHFNIRVRTPYSIL